MFSSGAASSIASGSKRSLIIETHDLLSQWNGQRLSGRRELHKNGAQCGKVPRQIINGGLGVLWRGRLKVIYEDRVGVLFFYIVFSCMVAPYRITVVDVIFQ